MTTLNILALTFDEKAPAFARFKDAVNVIKHREMDLELDKVLNVVTVKFVNEKGEFDKLVAEYDGQNLHVHFGIVGDCRIATVVVIDINDLLSYTAEY